MNSKNSKTILFAGLIVVMVLFSAMSMPSYADYLSPKKQLESGVLPEDIICRNNFVLVIRENGNPACVQESTAEKMNWSVIATEFNVTADTIFDLAEKPQTEKSITQNVEELMFAISSDVEFSGETHGYYEPEVLRRPAPKEMSINFASDHYDVKQTVQDYSTSLKLGKLDTNSLLEQLVTSNSNHENAIKYAQWLPTYIPDGFELKWIDIRQPEIYGDDIGRMQVIYIPNTVELSGDMLNSAAADIANVSVVVNVHPFDDDPFSQKRIDFVTKDGTSTQVFIEEKYGGILETIVESPSNHNVKGFELFTNTYDLTVIGTGLPLEEFEKILLDIYNRQ